MHPVSEVNAIESPEKDKFPDGGLIGVVVRQADESFDMRASVSTALHKHLYKPSILPISFFCVER